MLAPAVSGSIMETGSQKPAPNPVQRIFLAEAKARLEAACEAPVGFVERSSLSGRTISASPRRRARTLRITAGAFEREAIRPFVLGRFADMLKAVERHPAMQHYLDNAQSVGSATRRPARTPNGA